MADEGGADFSIIDAFGRRRARRRVNPFAPRRPPASEQPFEDAGPAVRHVGCAIPWIVKMLTVEMVGSRSAIEWHRWFRWLSCFISPLRREPHGWAEVQRKLRFLFAAHTIILGDFAAGRNREDAWKRRS